MIKGIFIRADTNQRTYQKKDLDIILEVKRLLYEEKLTIEGARQRLKKEVSKSPREQRNAIEDLKAGLREILKDLS